MSKAEKTKAFIIEQSADLFNTKGYRDTSLSDIVEVTGLTKGAIYGNFQDKDELALAVFHHNFTSLIERLDKVIDPQKSATDKLKALTSYYRDNWERMFERGGCPILNASVEADDNFDNLKKHVQDSINTWVGGICKIIERGQATGEFKTQIVAMAYAYTIVSLLEGGIMLAKIMDDSKLLLLSLDRIDFMVANEIRKPGIFQMYRWV